MNDNEWRQLVSSALENDKAAFERLYKETERSVYFLCLKLLGNEHDAKDIVQETYLAAYNGLSALDDGANFPKWVNGIAVNQCRKLFRVPENESFDEKLEQGKEFADEENFIPEEYVSDAEKRKAIMNIIDTELSEVQRQTVILYYYNGLKTHEIAGIMNCPEGTVKYRLSAAREKIREAVLIYEEEHKERLHAIMPIPVLTRILRSEAEQIAVPDIRLFENSAASANNIKAGGSASMKSALTGKIIAAAAAVVVIGGGIAAGVAMSNRDSGEIKVDSSDTIADTSSETDIDGSSAADEDGDSDEASETSSESDAPTAEAATERCVKMNDYIWYIPEDFHEMNPLSATGSFYTNPASKDEQIYFSLYAMHGYYEKHIEEQGEEEYDVHDIPELIWENTNSGTDRKTLYGHLDFVCSAMERIYKNKHSEEKSISFSNRNASFDVETEEDTELFGLPAIHRTGYVMLEESYGINDKRYGKVYFEGYYFMPTANGKYKSDGVSKNIPTSLVLYAVDGNDNSEALNEKLKGYLKEIIENSYYDPDGEVRYINDYWGQLV